MLDSLDWLVTLRRTLHSLLRICLTEDFKTSERILSLFAACRSLLRSTWIMYMGPSVSVSFEHCL
jgi:hypothetical protein